ncbi:hypothetical protein [Teredinibacter turnerae]|uniref:hypothetical protein n=1 Tax=Teredinibacter turnerae TaxID=2426 RepID=UPI00035C94D5|nr:hypothetical protein [Teredinibacter turnerae]
MKNLICSTLALLAISSTTLADTTHTLTNQSITSFRAFSTTLYFETNGFIEATCDDRSIQLAYNSQSGIQLFEILRSAAENNKTIKTIQYYWDSSEETCYLRFVDLK